MNDGTLETGRGPTASSPGDAMFENGRKRETDGDLVGAEAAYLEAVAARPEHAPWHYRLGCVLRKLGRIEEAAKAFHDAVRFGSGEARYLTNLGTTLDALGRREDAVHFYELAIRAGGDTVEAHHNLGALYAEAGRTREAIRCFEAALKLQPDAEGHQNLGLVHYHAGDLGAALEQFEASAALAPDAAQAHYFAALTLLKKGVYREALSCFEKAVRLDERLVRSYVHMGTCLHKLERLEDALKALRKGLDHLPDDGRCHYQLALTLDGLGLHREARTHYRLARRENT